ncbi:MAG: hypothetical protein K8R67_01765 [Desulfobacteraceae bacterium]|nr:hypothetical protein [Desulfobacteraceae bacterium]
MIILKENKNSISLILLFLCSVVIAYKTPQVINTIFQIILLIFFWRSKNNYFWLAFVFIVESEIGFLFPKADPRFSFSILPNSPFGNLYFSLVFLFVAFTKTLRKKPPFPLVVKKQIIMLSLYFFILLFIFGVFKAPAVLRLTLPWLLLFIVPHFCSTAKEIHNFFELIFPFVFIVLFSQVIYLSTGSQLGSFFGGIHSLVLRSGVAIVDTEHALRPVYGIQVPFMAIWGSLYFLSLKDTCFSKNYLFIILGISTFSIFITATRSWLVSSFFLIFFFLFISSRKKAKTLIQAIGMGIIVIVAISYSPSLQKQTELSFDRYETLESFATGDITAGGTLKRFDVRVKRPMLGFSKSPFIGLGVGMKYNFYADGHVGYHNLLMSSGIIGFLLWIMLWGMFLIKMLKLFNKMSPLHPYKTTPLILIAFMISILLIHTSTQWFGFLINFNNALFIALLFAMGSRLYYAKEYE